MSVAGKVGMGRVGDADWYLGGCRDVFHSLSSTCTWLEDLTMSFMKALRYVPWQISHPLKLNAVKTDAQSIRTLA